MPYDIPRPPNAVRVFRVDGMTHHQSYYREPFPPARYWATADWLAGDVVVRLSLALTRYRIYWQQHRNDTDAETHLWFVRMRQSRFQEECADLALE